MKHVIASNMLTRRVKVALIGVGGVGSQLLTNLCKLHSALVALGHPGGLSVTAYDSDTVSTSNVGRQNYSPADVGINKAVLSIHRINQFYGFDWVAVPENFTGAGYESYDLIISAVDTKAARRTIHNYCVNRRVGYWLDSGNLLSTGQVILGEPTVKYNRDAAHRLPTVTDLYPELLDASIPEDDQTPTCSLADALQLQDLFIGTAMALSAGDLLWKLFRQGGVDYHGSFINLANGTINPLPVDPATWERINPLLKPEEKPRKGRKAAK